MRKYIGLIICLAIYITSCQSQEKIIAPSTNGTWESLGSGWMLEIKDSIEYTFYDYTAISCLTKRSGAFKEIKESLKLSNDTLYVASSAYWDKFVRAEKLPQACNQKIDKVKSEDPIYNFDVFAETVKEHYAYLELNKINWNELYLKQKSKLNSQTTDAELYLLLEETLEKLNDNHAYLEATDEVEESVDAMFDDEIESTDDDALPEYGDLPVAEMVAKHHLQEEMTKDSWLVQWGKLNNDIGYVQIKAMWLHGDLDIPQQLIDEVGFVEAYIKVFNKMYDSDYVAKEVEGISNTMDKVMNDLSNMKSIILDVRFNGGGQDAVSYEILSRFIPQRIRVANHQFRYGNKHTELIPIYIDGRKDAYTKPVYILTSRKTGSAAESFSLASMEMVNVKRIGSPTAGAMSSALEKRLPNGWLFCISNEIAKDNNGNFYENKGVPPDYKLDYPSDIQTFFRSVANDLEKDKQDILKAIEMLEDR